MCLFGQKQSWRRLAKVKFEPQFSQISVYNAKILKTGIFMFDYRFFYIGGRILVNRKLIWVIYGSKKQNVMKVTCFAELEN